MHRTSSDPNINFKKKSLNRVCDVVRFIDWGKKHHVEIFRTSQDCYTVIWDIDCSGLTRYVCLRKEYL